MTLFSRVSAAAGSSVEVVSSAGVVVSVVSLGVVGSAGVSVLPAQPANMAATMTTTSSSAKSFFRFFFILFLLIIFIIYCVISTENYRSGSIVSAPRGHSAAGCKHHYICILLYHIRPPESTKMIFSRRIIAFPSISAQSQGSLMEQEPSWQSRDGRISPQGGLTHPDFHRTFY